MTRSRDLASSGVTLTSTTTTADAALARAGGTMTGDLAMGTNLVDGVDVSARDAVLTSTTTLASAALPKSGGAMTGAITTNSTFDGVDIATRDAVLSSTTTTATNALNNANNALPKEGGAMTGPITTNSTFDGVDVGSRDSVLTSTTTTADAALPRTGGAMTGAITTNSTFDGVDIATRDAVLTATTTTANAALPKAGGTLTGDVTFNTQLGIGAAPHATASLNITNTNQHIRLNNGSELGVIALLSSGELELWGHGANESINFRTGSGSGNIAMNIVGNNVGIGTTAPTATLHVVTPYSEGIRFSDSTGTPYSILQSGSGYAGIGTNSLNNIISWKTNDSLGHVGINTTAPNDKLHIKNGFLRIQAGDQSSGAHTSKYGVRWTQETDVEVARIEVERPAWSGAPSRMNFYTRTPANAVNKTLAIDEYGIVTTPYQPRFKTYLNASTGATTFSASTVHRVPFASEHWDVGNNFNTSDYMFHAPVDGIYLFNVAVLLHSVSTGTSNCEISFRHEDHATYYGQRVDASTGWGDNYVSLNATAHIKLDAGDTVSAKVYCTEAFGIYGNGGGASTYFSGVLEG